MYNKLIHSKQTKTVAYHMKKLHRAPFSKLYINQRHTLIKTIEHIYGQCNKQISKIYLFTVTFPIPSRKTIVVLYKDEHHSFKYI